MDESSVPESSSETRWRVFLVEDHPLVREWLSNLVERYDDLKVCGFAETPSQALEAMRAPPT